MNVKEKIDALDNRQFYGLLASGLTLFFAALVSYVLIPQYKSYAAELKAHDALPSMPVDSSQLESILQEKDNEIVKRARLMHGDMASLPIREVEAFVIDRLQKIAWTHSVMLEGVKPEAGDRIEPFSEVLFRLDISGQYADLFEWLQALKKELGFIVIKEYRMSRFTQESTDPVLRVQLTIASYRKESG
ncbi:MAG: hypothetical protein AB8G18_08880 [Gammaproteobacteria bacterium]